MHACTHARMHLCTHMAGQACTANSTACEGWLFYEDKYCYLYKFTYKGVTVRTPYSFCSPLLVAADFVPDLLMRCTQCRLRLPRWICSGGKCEARWGNKCDNFKKITFRDVYRCWCLQVCDVMRDTYGYGTALDNYEYVLTSLSSPDQDAECCNHCHERDECDFWIRSTGSDVSYCYLYKDFTSSKFGYSTWRTGLKKSGSFVDRSVSRAIELGWKLFGKILGTVTVWPLTYGLWPADYRAFGLYGLWQVKMDMIPGLRVDEPNELHADRFAVQDGKLTGELSDLSIAVHVPTDWSAKALSKVIACICIFFCSLHTHNQ